MKKLTAKTTPRHLQATLVTIVLAGALYSFAETMYWMVAQFPDNANMSGFMGTIVLSFLYPVAVGGLAYLLISRKIPVLQKLFESTIVAVIGFCLMMIVQRIASSLLSSLGIYEATWEALGAFMFWTVQTILPLALIALYLVIARRKKQW